MFMRNLKKNIVEIKNFRHKTVLKRDFMINRLEKNIDNKEKNFLFLLMRFCAEDIM